MRPPEEDESLVQHIVRSAKNSFQQAFGCIQTSDEKAKIKYKEYRMENRKKAFGVEYMNMKRVNATEEELKNCVTRCGEDLDVIKQEIETLEGEIKRVDDAVKSKIVAKPGTKPTDTKVEDAKPAEPAEVEVTPIETKQEETKPAEVQKVEVAKPVEAPKDEPTPVETKMEETKPAEASYGLPATTEPIEEETKSAEIPLVPETV
jgi:chromosome segregation ATPase